MKTVKEMIKVMQSWNGSWGADCNIQYLLKGSKVWENYDTFAPEWNWIDYDYRVDIRTMTPQEKVEALWNGFPGERCNIEYQMKTADARKSHWKKFTENEIPTWNWKDVHYRVKHAKPWLFGKKEN